MTEPGYDSGAPIHARALLDFTPEGRVERRSFPEGTRLEEIVQSLLPDGFTKPDFERCRVAIVGKSGRADIVQRDIWRLIRPRAGTCVVVTVVPGDDVQLKSALLIAVTIGATALGQLWAPAIFGSTALGSALVTAGIPCEGGLFMLEVGESCRCLM